MVFKFVRQWEGACVLNVRQKKLHLSDKVVYSLSMKTISSREFQRQFGRWKGETVEVTDRGVVIGIWKALSDKEVEEDLSDKDELGVLNNGFVQNSKMDELREKVKDIEAGVKEEYSSETSTEVFVTEEMLEVFPCDLCSRISDYTFWEEGDEKYVCDRCVRKKFGRGADRVIKGYKKV